MKRKECELFAHVVQLNRTIRKGCKEDEGGNKGGERRKKKSRTRKSVVGAIF